MVVPKRGQTRNSIGRRIQGKVRRSSLQALEVLYCSTGPSLVVSTVQLDLAKTGKWHYAKVFLWRGYWC